MTPSRLSACVAESAALLPSVLLDNQLVHANRVGALVSTSWSHIACLRYASGTRPDWP